MIRVAVVDDEELVRSGFVVLLGSSPDIEVVGQAGDGAEAWELCRRANPDVVLMDVRMPRMDGLEATRRIIADPRCAGTHVLVLTTFDDDELVHGALRAGASGFLLKDTRPTHLLDAISVVAAGDALLAPSVTRRLIEQFATLPTRPVSRADDGLTDREREVLILIARGLSTKEIASNLDIGGRTVETHRANLMRKLGVKSVALLTQVAIREGIVPIPPSP